ncbi:AsmA family protein [Chitinibacter fontanus]|uniref:AsmA family protein n=1 Tax=Chitinibacter fontanus TaxID=1737446 RepID=A0A7D5V939_9NEIS|nr:AsmA family protein [Chitinibacter fontanus]QLI80453.1 AsmA family protein [Chitinibacter fontanus]
MDWRHSRPIRILILLVLILSTLVGVLPYFLSFDSVREQIIAQVQADTQRTMSIRGSAHVVLLPRPAILLNDTTLSEPQNPTIFAHAESLKVVFRLWPLITTGKPVIHAIEVEQPELSIVRNENGTYNFEDLLRPHSDKVGVALDKLSFLQAKLSWKDEFLGETLHLSQLDLIMDQLTDPKKGNLSLQGKASMGEKTSAPVWQGEISGSAAMRYLEKERTLRIADIELNLIQQGESAPELQVKDAKLSATGNLNYSWEPLRLTGGDMKVSSSANRAGQLWTSALDIPEIQLTDTSLNLNRLKFDIGMKDQHSELSAKTYIPTLGGAHRSFLRTEKAQISLKYKSPEQNLAIQLTTPMELYRGYLARLAAYKLTGNYSNRSLPRGEIRLALEGHGDLDLRNEVLSLESRGQLDGENISSQINLENFIAPQYRVNIDLAKLDLTPYLPVVSAGAKTVDHAAALDFWWLKNLNAIGSVKIGELVLQNMHVDDLSMKLIARNQRIVLDPLSATIYEGRLNGRAEIDASKKPVYFRLEQMLTNMNINTLLTDVLDTSRFEGRSDIIIDVAAVGNKLADLRHTAGGNIRMRLKQGAIRGIDIPALLRTASQQIKLMNGETAPISAKDARTQFTALQATWQLKHGIASNNDLNISAGILNLSGGGEINLGSGELNYNMKASANPNVPELSGLKGLTLPISFSGPLNAPEYKADYTSLKAQIMARQEAEQKAKAQAEAHKAAQEQAKAAAQRKAAEKKAASQRNAAKKPAPTATNKPSKK